MSVVSDFIVRWVLLINLDETFQASTMDGRVTAMDVSNNGEVVWSVDADKVPLLSSSLGSQQVSHFEEM